MKKNGNELLNKKRKQPDETYEDIDSIDIHEESEEFEENEDIEEDEENQENQVEELSNDEDSEKLNNQEDSEDVHSQKKVKNLKKSQKITMQMITEKENNAKKGKSITNQKKIFDMVIGLRISLQKFLKNSNSMNYKKFAKYISEIFSNNEERKIKIVIHSLRSFYDILLSYISLLESLCQKGNLYNQKNLDISAIKPLLEEIENEMEKINSFKPNKTDKLEKKNSESYLDFIEKSIMKTYKNIELIYENISKLYYAVFNIWHKKTLAYDNKKTKFGDNLNLFNFSENISKYLDLNFKKIILKYQVNNTDNQNESIYQYQDDEYYNNLLKDIISEKDENSLENTYTNESRFDYTYNYLLNRSQKTKKKIVDTKASKNRKLRFETHEKIINFLVPIQNLNIHEGRDAFIKSIFGLNRKIYADLIHRNEDLTTINLEDDHDDINLI